MTTTRRDVLRTGAAAGAFAALGPIALARAASDSPARLAVIVLRGGLDALSLAPATGDPAFAALRGGLANPHPRDGDFVDLDGFFGLHPKLPTLAELWRARELTIVHAIASGHRRRSHFDAQDELETGLNRPDAQASGWLNRTVAALGGGTGVPKGLAVGPSVPLILRGSAPVSSWSPPRLQSADPDLLQRLAAIAADDPLIGPALAAGVEARSRAVGALGAGMAGPREPGYGRETVRLLAEAAGRLMRPEGAPRIAAFDIGGWDTHGSQNIYLSYRMPYLDDAIAGLRQGLGGRWSTTAVVVITEFGRTAVPNGTKGTDHGTATAAILAGGAVAGGKVVADWPGLKRAQLHEARDLRPTGDVRSVFKGVLRDHLAIAPDLVERRVFAESPTIRPLDGLIRI